MVGLRGGRASARVRPSRRVWPAAGPATLAAWDPKRGRESMRRTRVGMTTLAVLLAVIGGTVLVAGSGGLAQEDTPPRPSHVHAGDCDEPGEIVQPLTALNAPEGDVSGNSDAVVAESAFTTIPLSLEDLLAEDHSLKVHLSQAEIGTYLAC